MDTVTIEKDITIKASAEEIYEMWLDSNKHTALIGEKVQIHKQAGTHFSAFDGWVTGEIKELKQDEKIVMTWRPDEPGWPEDLYSEVTLLFEENDDSTTTIHFTQTNLPENIHEDFEKGWEEYYWGPLKERFE